MHIEKLEIKAFGKLKDITLDLSKGLNIVYGSNEAGKTSIQWFIKAMFFGLKGGRTAKDGTQPPLKRYKPWDGNDYGGAVEYRLDNGEVYRIVRNYTAGTVKIYDRHFNDISGLFEASRERGAHFAEKHLGVNEICFDKTSFIRQMESRIGDDDTRELLNRLINVSQTGFEDVSFKRAHEALKEALKNYVGTDKTSTRPLDKLTQRLNELEAIRSELIHKREALFDLERELKTATEEREMLENRRMVLSKLKETVNAAKSLLTVRKLKVNINNILKNIKILEEELKTVEVKIEEYSRDTEQLTLFSCYSMDDLDEVVNCYNRMVVFLKETGKLEDEVNRKKEEIIVIEHQLEAFKAFNYLEDNAGNNVFELNRELDYLKKEHDKGNLDILNERIKNIRTKEKGYTYKTLFSAVAAAVLLFTGFFGLHIGPAIAIIALVPAISFGILKTKEAKELNILLNEKKVAFININEIIGEINKKQKALKDIYESVGATGIEDFLKLKADYNSKINQITALSSDVERLEREQENSSHKAAELEKLIRGKLAGAGIINSDSMQITDESINSFKYGVRRYHGLEPSINYAKQRLDDLQNNLQDYFKSISSMSGKSCTSREDLMNIIGTIHDEEAELNEAYENLEAQVKALEAGNRYMQQLKDCLGNNSSSAGVDNMEKTIDIELCKVEDELGAAVLKIKEYETLLKGANDDEKLQAIEEELEDLKAEKSRLDDMHKSLKVAMDVMSEASSEIQRDFVPALNQRMSKIIGRISGGRYNDLRADDRLILKVLVPETGDVVTALSLSGGTIDQTYLALRIAMADMISEAQEKLPFIMDEVLAQYDDTRTSETLQFLDELSRERQVILFTCKHREIDIAREVCGRKLNITKLA